MSSEEEEKARPKSEIAWAANPSQTRDFPLSLEARLASPSCISPKLGMNPEYRICQMSSSYLDTSAPGFNTYLKFTYASFLLSADIFE